MRTPLTAPVRAQTRFHHEAFLYSDAHDYVGSLVPFIAEGLDDGDAVVVLVPTPKIGLLRDGLGGDASRVVFEDMLTVGHNPGRIIPAWMDLVAPHLDEGRKVRGIGEPVWPGRNPDQLAECRRHEALLGLTFSGGPPWWLVCPYDAGSLPDAALDGAHRTHPSVVDVAGRTDSARYEGWQELDPPLPSAPEGTRRSAFDLAGLSHLRRTLSREIERLGIADGRDFITAVNEVATNSVRYGGGGGTMRLWVSDHGLVVEVSDRGWIGDPLVGRRRPDGDVTSGRGLWLANQLCDLVQVRSSREGTTVRLHLLESA